MAKSGSHFFQEQFKAANDKRAAEYRLLREEEEAQELALELEDSEERQVSSPKQVDLSQSKLTQPSDVQEDQPKISPEVESELQSLLSDAFGINSFDADLEKLITFLNNHPEITRLDMSEHINTDTISFLSQYVFGLRIDFIDTVNMCKDVVGTIPSLGFPLALIVPPFLPFVGVFALLRVLVSPLFGLFRVSDLYSFSLMRCNVVTKLARVISSSKFIDAFNISKDYLAKINEIAADTSIIPRGYSIFVTATRQTIDRYRDAKKAVADIFALNSSLTELEGIDLKDRNLDLLKIFIERNIEIKKAKKQVSTTMQSLLAFACGYQQKGSAAGELPRDMLIEIARGSLDMSAEVKCYLKDEQLLDRFAQELDAHYAAVQAAKPTPPIQNEMAATIDDEITRLQFYF